jgi:hypothetical protein
MLHGSLAESVFQVGSVMHSTANYPVFSPNSPYARIANFSSIVLWTMFGIFVVEVQREAGAASSRANLRKHQA